MDALVTPTAEDLSTSAAFEALMWALARPGMPQRVRPDGPAQRQMNTVLALAESLLDREATVFADDDALAVALAQTGARAAPITEAHYVFCTLSSAEGVETAARASIGTSLYPDAAATIFAPATFGDGVSLRLTGPGIARQAPLSVGGIHPSFWSARTRAARYPLGWDVYLVAGQEVVGLPRSTKVEVI